MIYTEYVDLGRCYVCHNILPKQIVFEVIDKGDI